MKTEFSAKLKVFYVFQRYGVTLNYRQVYSMKQRFSSGALVPSVDQEFPFGLQRPKFNFFFCGAATHRGSWPPHS